MKTPGELGARRIPSWAAAWNHLRPMASIGRSPRRRTVLRAVQAGIVVCCFLTASVASADGAPRQVQPGAPIDPRAALLTFAKLDAAFSGLTHRIGVADEQPSADSAQSTACHDLFGNLGQPFAWPHSQQIATVAFRDHPCPQSQYEIRETIAVYPDTPSGSNAASTDLRKNVKLEQPHYRSGGASASNVDPDFALFFQTASGQSPSNSSHTFDEFAREVVYPAPRGFPFPYHEGLGFIRDRNVIIVIESTGPGPGGYLDMSRFATEALAQERCTFHMTPNTCPLQYSADQVNVDRPGSG